MFDYLKFEYKTDTTRGKGGVEKKHEQEHMDYSGGQVLW